MATLTTSRVAAVFNTHADAERAITALRQVGITDSDVSIVARHGEETEVAGGGTVAEADTAGERVGKGALAGAGVGTLFGLAAVAIPGVGPFITAGWLASALGITGGAAAAGAIVGGTSGAIAGLFTKAGYEEHEANYYGTEVERGGVFVAVDTSNSTVSPTQVADVLRQYGGRSSATA